MKPLLKNGVPVGQRIKREPHDVHSPIFLCWCDHCATQGGIIVTPEGQSLQGQSFYSDAALKEHLAYMRKVERTFGRHDNPPLPLDVSPPFTVEPSSESLGIPIPPQIAASVSYPLPLSLAIKTDGSDVASQTSSYSLGPEPSLPQTMRQPLSLEYEWMRLETIARQLQSLEADALRHWNPAEIDFKEGLNESDFVDYPSLSSLVSGHGTNTLFLGHLEWMRDSRRALEKIHDAARLSSRFSCKHTVVSRCLAEAEATTRTKLLAEWILRRNSLMQERVHSTREAIKSYALKSFFISPFHSATIPEDLHHTDRIFVLLLLIAATLHLVCNMSTIPLVFFLRSMRLVFRILGFEEDRINTRLPEDMRTVLNRLDLQPTYVAYVCCPMCFQIYDLDNCPKMCNNTSSRTSRPCNRRLLHDSLPAHPKSHKSIKAPVRSYFHQDMKHWLAWMHNRKDLEHYLERPYTPLPPSEDNEVSDIWESDFLRNFHVNEPSFHNYSSPANATTISISQQSSKNKRPVPVSDLSFDSLGKARLAYLQQESKSYLLKNFSTDVLLLLAEELKLGPILTPKGKTSRDRKQIVNALLQRVRCVHFLKVCRHSAYRQRDSNTGSEHQTSVNHDPGAPSTVMTEAAQTKDLAEDDMPVSQNKAQILYRTATKAKINRLRRPDLVAVWKIASHFIAAANRARLAATAKKTAENDWYEDQEYDDSNASLGGSNGFESADEEDNEIKIPSRNQVLKDEIHRYVCELEKTMFTHFCMMQKLRSRLHDSHSSPEFEELSNIYRNTFEETNARGTRGMDVLASDDYSVFSTSVQQRLSRTVCSQLQMWINDSHFPGSVPALVHNHASVNQRGVTFSPRNHSQANARVVFQTTGTEEWSAGSIKSIFTAKWTSSGQGVVKTFAEINSYIPLTDSDAVHDHFRAFGFAAGRLFYDRLGEDTFLIPLDRVASHFGYTPWTASCIDREVMHALPFSKASKIYTTACTCNVLNISILIM
ncbi:hypothetical protein HHX47_DHR3000942 [Lentinula edodes]|nr:hypothetical protein HHX47_DHR3000942 [Lentinula edodes]